MIDHLPTGWALAASAFNWTPEVIRAERATIDITAGIVEQGVASTIEIEPGQLWRSFPRADDEEVDALRERVATAGGDVSIVGASLDDWAADGSPLDAPDRLDFLLPQLRAASRLGATGVRLPLGQSGRALLELLRPHLEELDIVLFEEAQGQQTPAAQQADFDTIAELDDPRIRVLLDISMLMPALPPSYLEQLRSGGLDAALLRRLEHDWQDPQTHTAVVDTLRAGAVPPSIHTLYMNLLVRFGRSAASELRGILPLISGVHLKFWDLDDDGGRVTRPIREIGHELGDLSGRGAPFEGTLCSEWGGHEWLDDDPTDMTKRHLAMAEAALVDGAHGRG